MRAARGVRGGAAYASLILTVTAVFLLITAQLVITSTELRVSHMHERYAGLYETGVAAAEARVKGINKAISEAGDGILSEYMGRYDWQSQCERQGGALTLTGEAFGRAYREIALTYLDPPKNAASVITQESGMQVSVQPAFGNPGEAFSVTVTNKGARPFIANMNDNDVLIQGELAWNPEPPVYTLRPLFDMDAETLEGKGFKDFIITREPGVEDVVLAGVHRA